MRCPPPLTPLPDVPSPGTDLWLNVRVQMFPHFLIFPIELPPFIIPKSILTARTLSRSIICYPKFSIKFVNTFHRALIH